MPATIPTLLLWLLAALLGLSLGSFLNVVITRLPVMLMRGWRAEARAALSLEPEASPRFDLLRPSSMCPRCEAPIAWRHNLPLLGWLWLRGRCAHCHKPISVQYPLVELAGGLFTLAVLALQGPTLEAAFILGACLTLLALAVIDLRLQILPDILTLPLLWAGLLYHLLFQPLGLPDAVLGAMLGYLALWGFHGLFQRLTGKRGMGHGDFKLLAALGAWFGWPYLPLLLVLSAAGGALFGLVAQALDPRRRGQPMPFGPWLALAGWIMLLAGEPLMALYLQWIA
ncbi:prepilin peptidase [Halomonas elongata]|uniref:Prepilin leader peptidase/N-methyltransferase n=2 Tax=Halomonas elongata TaxID=2746 RepID=E1V3B5_HALED|nr:A24 family peptidase [Halomonas elongata]OBX36276.1 type 4 prepilin-like protein leader peptide-processing enzyme [Halomonas elongata]WBF19890.1 A24 family peptidase [Halomonas elongata]WPU48759.1 A24 family peptidase [Halomonas elongata DSM 2581]CBV42594.1 prepilin peptidase [Halomonas elongata DSM 2581]